jgi:hypothetical protein
MLMHLIEAYVLVNLVLIVALLVLQAAEALT